MSRPPGTPRSVVTARRHEQTALLLNRLEGEMPPDLAGHLFFLTLAGHEESGGLPFVDGTHMLNSDGMLHRLDLSNGEARITSRLVKTPCFYADVATERAEHYKPLRFQNLNLVRWSWTLGQRNLLNTAFMTMPDGEGPARLCLTYDAGRPYEIDLETLELVTPVGYCREWRPEAMEDMPFPPVMTSAHPFYDAHTGEAFLVNYGRSTNNLAQGVPFIKRAQLLPKLLDRRLEQMADALRPHPLALAALRKAARSALRSLNRVRQGSHGQDSLLPKDFTYLLRWDGKGELERWQLVLPDGTPARIEMTMHQIGVTRDYVVIMDTGFKLGLDQIYNNTLPGAKGLERLLHLLTSTPQLSYAPIYIVRRADLKKDAPKGPDGVRTVPAKRLVLPMESVHFMTDYENPDGRITLHLAHANATDIAEQLRTYDVCPATGQPVDSGLHGMFTVGMDVNRLGRYEIDGETGTVLDSRLISDDERTWGISFPTSRYFQTDEKPPTRYGCVYWAAVGFSGDLVSQFIYELYRDYPHRLAPLDQLDRMQRGEDRPSCLLRIDADPLRIGDSYRFPAGVMVSTPQFVPRRGGSGGEHDGYIVATAFTRRGSELWVFDAADLERGPLCKLHHPDLVFAFSIHSAWLPEIGKRRATYQVPIREDFEERLRRRPLLRAFFEKEVFPHFR